MTQNILNNSLDFSLRFDLLIALFPTQRGIMTKVNYHLSTTNKWKSILLFGVSETNTDAILRNIRHISDFWLGDQFRSHPNHVLATDETIFLQISEEYRLMRSSGLVLIPLLFTKGVINQSPIV